MTRKEGKSVDYYDKNGFQILMQMYGSVWPKVLPYCLLNVAISALAQYLDSYENIHLDISDLSHSFMNMLVAFLVVTRISMSVSRYYDCRGAIGKMCLEIRELLQNMTVLTRNMNQPNDRDWRNETAYRALLLLQTSMAVLDYRSLNAPAWEIPELSPKEAAELKNDLFFDFGNDEFSDRSEYDESMRVPPLMAYKLRLCLDSCSERLSARMPELREYSLYTSVDAFMDGYYTITKLVTTQFPFPLVQMERTFVLFYVFTVPFAMLSDISSPYMHLLVVFFLTYGFVGLELISVELDDPFGDDPNDFNNMAMAQVVVEDAYLLIYTQDGKQYLDRLRRSLNRAEESTRRHVTEETFLMSKP